MVRLAHLSDIHLTYPTVEWRLGDWFSKRSVSWFNFRWLGRRHRFRHADEVLIALMADVSARNIEHVIFSGDATALGFESEFRRAAELLDVGNRQGLAVPGNHDYCTPFAARSGLFEKYFAPWQNGRRVDDAHYPFAQRVGPAWVLAVNSATGNTWPWDAGGGVGPAQLDRLGRLLAQLEPGPRLLVTHFPVCLASGRPEPGYHGLRDLDQVVQVAAQGGVRLWLHGHRHGPYVLHRSDLAPFPIICAGSGTQTGLWSYFEYHLETDQLQAQRRFFDPQAKHFRAGDTIAVPLS